MHMEKSGAESCFMCNIRNSGAESCLIFTILSFNICLLIGV